MNKKKMKFLLEDLLLVYLKQSLSYLVHFVLDFQATQVCGLVLEQIQGLNKLI